MATERVLMGVEMSNMPSDETLGKRPEDDIDAINVILVGGNHHNGLGLARSFRRHGIRPYGIIVNPEDNVSYIAESKYWADVEQLHSDLEIVPMLMGAHRYLSKGRTVVIPWSDGAVAVIDGNSDLLSKHFIIPSIGDKRGEIVRLLDKRVQVSFLAMMGFSMLPTELIELSDYAYGELPFPFPVLIKPASGIEGSKADMFVCQNSEEFETAFNVLRNREFKRALVQHYLGERTEYVVDGAVFDDGIAFTVLKNLRQWPVQFGAGTFAELDRSKHINTFCANLLECFRKDGFRGVIDVEVFEGVDHEFYINEINWRSGGRNFVAAQSNVYPAYAYYCDVTGLTYEEEYVNTKSGWSMNEFSDIKNVLYGGVGFGEWFNDFRRSSSYAVWDARDVKPFLTRCASSIKHATNLCFHSIR